MAEKRSYDFTSGAKIAIEVCLSGFMVVGNRYGGNDVRAFSTVEGLIEWLSRELGAGLIVWAWTIPIWADIAGVKEEDLLPMPDPSVDITGYHEAQEYNAAFLISRFAEQIIKAKSPPLPPEPKPKKEKKVKEKISKRFNSDFREPPPRTGELKEEPVVGPPGKAQGGG